VDDVEEARRQMPVSTRPRLANISSRTAPQWKSQQKTLWATVLEETRKHPGPVRTRDRTKIAELFADERCSKAILDFLAAVNGRRQDGRPASGSGGRGSRQ